MVTAMHTARMKPGQYREAGAALARAFYDDPLMTWVLPDDTTRLNKLTWFMGLAAKYGMDHGEVETTQGAVEGCAIWLPPGKTDVPPLQMMLAGMWMAPFKLGMGSMMKFMKAMDFMEKQHHEAVPAPHHYLMVLGVDPPRQGQGVGSALMAPMLARADAGGKQCYLETNKEINVKLYQKHGFEVHYDGFLPGDGPRVWTMKRPAQ